MAGYRVWPATTTQPPLTPLNPFARSRSLPLLVAMRDVDDSALTAQASYDALRLDVRLFPDSTV